MTDVNDYMIMLRESQLKRTIVIEDVDKIISENAQLKELLKLARSSVDYHCALCREYIDGKILIAKIDEVIK